MKKIPFHTQKNDYYCGPATLQMILAAFGITASQDALAKAAKTNQKVGTGVLNLVRVLRSYKLQVRAGNHKKISDIAKAQQNDTLVIVCYTEPILEWGHYAIVDRLTPTRIRLIDSDARTGKTSMLIDEFERRWKDPLFTKTVRWAAFVSGAKYPRKES